MIIGKFLVLSNKTGQDSMENVDTDIQTLTKHVSRSLNTFMSCMICTEAPRHSQPPAVKVFETHCQVGLNRAIAKVNAARLTYFAFMHTDQLKDSIFIIIFSPDVLPSTMCYHNHWFDHWHRD